MFAHSPPDAWSAQCACAVDGAGAATGEGDTSLVCTSALLRKAVLDSELQ